VPPEAVPAREIVGVPTVTSTDTGEVMATVTGALLTDVAGGGVSVILAVWEVVSCAASKAVKLTAFEPFTRVTALALQPAPLREAAPLEPWFVCHWTVMGGTPPDTVPVTVVSLAAVDAGAAFSVN
jgi:hypothetical protein